MKMKFYLAALIVFFSIGCQKEETGKEDELTIEREEEYKGRDTSEINPVP